MPNNRQYLSHGGKNLLIADLSYRISAFVLDFFIVSFLSILFFWAMSEMGPIYDSMSPNSAEESEVAILYGTVTAFPYSTIAIALAYHVMGEQSSWQATVGKLLMGIYVADSEGEKLTFWQSLLRNAMKIAFLFLPPWFTYFLEMWRIFSEGTLMFVILSIPVLWIVMLVASFSNEKGYMFFDIPTKSLSLKK